MNFFKKTEKTKCCLIKEVSLTIHGYAIIYYTTVNGMYLSSSLSTDREKAEQFFNMLLINKGKVINKEEVRIETI